MEKLRQFWAWSPGSSAWSGDPGCGPERIQGISFEFESAGRVPAGGSHTGVAKLVSNGSQIDSRLQEANGTRMANQVRPDFGRKTRVRSMQACGVLSEDVTDPVTRNTMAAGVTKDGLFWARRDRW